VILLWGHTEGDFQVTPYENEVGYYVKDWETTEYTLAIHYKQIFSSQLTVYTLTSFPLQNILCSFPLQNILCIMGLALIRVSHECIAFTKGSDSLCYLTAVATKRYTINVATTECMKLKYVL